MDGDARVELVKVAKRSFCGELHTLNLAMVHPWEDTTQDQIAIPVSRGCVPGSGRMAWSIQASISCDMKV